MKHQHMVKSLKSTKSLHPNDYAVIDFCGYGNDYADTFQHLENFHALFAKLRN